LSVKNEGGKLVASWPWSGENAVKKAELVVAYGRVVPWHGWVFRHHEIFPATLNGNSATAEIPLPEKDLEAYVYGNITDERDVVISTVPVTVKPAALGITAATAPKLTLNSVFYGRFEPDYMAFLQGSLSFSQPADTEVKHSGAQSVRLETKDIKRPLTATLKLQHVPEHSHTLKLWLKANQTVPVRVSVVPVPPANWKSKAVDLLRREAEATAGVEAKEVPANLQGASNDVEVGTDWKQCTLAVPFDGAPIEGYNLTLKPIVANPTDATAPAPIIWLDDLRFEPVWAP
jgi:hypothetical protein